MNENLRGLEIQKQHDKCVDNAIQLEQSLRDMFATFVWTTKNLTCYGISTDRAKHILNLIEEAHEIHRKLMQMTQ